MNEEKTVKSFQQSRLIFVMVFGLIVIFTIVIGLSLYNIGIQLMDEADSRYQLVTDNVSQEITTWFSNEAQIVLNQKAAIEINQEYAPDELTGYLTSIVEDYNEDGYIYDLYFVNTDNIMSSGYGYIPDPSIDFRTRLWYTGALEHEDLFYSPPYMDTNLVRYIVTISTPCYKADGQLAGVLALDIFVDTLFSIANDKVLDGDSYVFLIDSSMGIATHPNSEYGYVNDEPIKTSDIPNGKYQYIVDYIENENNAKNTRSHYNIKDYDGVDRSIYVSNIDCCGWYSVAAIESSVFIEPLLKTLLIVIASLIICLVGGIITTRFITGRIIRQLNDANEAAIAANETKGVFLANMSHEIRTPINAIIGMNEMVIRENNDPNINDYALDIASASRSLITIVNDILDFSKIESGKMDLVETEFNFASIINDVVNMSESRLSSKDLSLFYDIDPTIPVGIVGDEMRIKQIILNMMTNAIKYTHEGYVTMSAKYSVQEYGINLNVSVKDTGIGISEENLEQLFESFQRFDTKRNRSIEGTGLGLSITKRLVNSMGGFINVKSKLGEGSEFSFSIPLKVSNFEPFVQIENPDSIKLIGFFVNSSMDSPRGTEATRIFNQIKKELKLDFTRVSTLEEFQQEIATEKYTHILIDQSTYFSAENYFKELSTQTSVIVLQKRVNAYPLPASVINFYTPFYAVSLAALLNNKKQADAAGTLNQLTFIAPTAKVMIVDDNEMNLKVAAGLMKPYNMKVTTVDSGVKAIDLLKIDPSYDIVFMDHMMPIMDGIEATKLIREMNDDYYTKLPIVALTANTVNNAKQLFLNSGFNDFLAKPININFLDKMLRTYLPEEKLNPVDKVNTNVSNIVKVSDSSNKIFDPATGLSYAGGNRELYLDILKGYVTDAVEMKANLNSSKDASDWKNYVIKVHALKSMSLTIGAVSLSEQAKELELAGKAANYELVIEKNSVLMDKYEQVLADVVEYLKENNIDIDNTEVPEITDISSDLDSNKILEYASELKNALDEFDTDKVEEIYNNMGDYQKVFSKVYSLATDFEYTQAIEEVERISGTRKE